MDECMCRCNAQGMSVLPSFGPPLNRSTGAAEGSFRGNDSIQFAVCVKNGWGLHVSVGGPAVGGSMPGVELHTRSFNRGRGFALIANLRIFMREPGSSPATKSSCVSSQLGFRL